MPYGTSGSTDRGANAPRLFAGNVFPGLSARQIGGWATVEFPLLLYQSYGGGGFNNRRLFGRDLYGQLAIYLHLGDKVLRPLGASWGRIDAYAFLEQNLTPNKDRSTGRTDRFNPVILYGVSIPVGDEAGRRP